MCACAKQKKIEKINKSKSCCHFFKLNKFKYTRLSIAWVKLRQTIRVYLTYWTQKHQFKFLLNFHD